MEIDYPFLDLMQTETEYQYVPWNSDGNVEEITSEEMETF